MTKLLLLIALPILAAGADLNGDWSVRLIRLGEQFGGARVSLKADGQKVTGTLNELKLDGSLNGDHLTLEATRPNGKEWGKFEGNLRGDDITGKVRTGDDEFEWTAHRAPVVKSEPTTHTFEPTLFHRVFSGAI